MNQQSAVHWSVSIFSFPRWKQPWWAAKKPGIGDPEEEQRGVSAACLKRSMGVATSPSE